MRYLVTTNCNPPFLTNHFDCKNNFDEYVEMIVYDLICNCFSINGKEMKELDNIKKDNVEFGQTQKKKSQKILVDRIIPHENHICFQYNTKTNVFSRAVFKKQDVKIWDSKLGIQHGAIKKEIITESDCIYTSNLNKENATEHFSRIIGRKISPLFK